MIKKLEIKKVPVPNNPALVKNIGMDNESLFYKINELVDAVNELTSCVGQLGVEFIDPTPAENVQKETFVSIDEALKKAKKPEPAAPYTEQRKWIGKMCRFYDDDAFITSNDWAFGILTSIDKGMQYQYCCNENCNFKHCEPVKPDDDIIYKGE